MSEVGPLRSLTPTGEEDRAVQGLKTPPHSIEAEQSVLGALLLDNTSWDLIAHILTDKDFYRAEHAVIYQAIGRLIGDNRPADVLTVHEELKPTGLAENFGIIYLNQLASNTPSAANIRGYATIINDRSILRRLIQTADSIANSAFIADGKNVRSLLDEAESRILQIGQDGGRQSEYLPIDQLMTEAINRIQELFDRGSKSDITGIATGFIDLDRKTSGLQKGDLIIVAGRPSMGKTSLAMNIAENVAIKEGLPVLIFSMEMAASQLASRMLGSVGKVNQGRLRTGQLSDEEWPRVTQAVGQLSLAPILVDETGSLNSLELRARARRMARKYGNVGLIVIDYLQLMSGKVGAASENRATEISEISRSLKSLAKEMQCPVIALSQLNRGLENRENKRPIMSDLRECVTGETLVCLADGTSLPIAQLLGVKPLVFAMNEQQEIVLATAELVWSAGIKPVMRVLTQSGKCFRATLQHRVFTSDGWKHISQLQVGDELAQFLPQSNGLYDGVHPGWDAVQEIESDGLAEVFDLTVPKHHSWLMDGLVSHNSGAIEQDADVIIFIYRDEVYNPDTDQAGVAEIIIGKQRNGPIGVVKLSWQGEFTKFDNLALGYAPPPFARNSGGTNGPGSNVPF